MPSEQAGLIETDRRVGPTSKAATEIMLTHDAEMHAKALNFVAVLDTATEMNKADLKASGAYWEGIAYFNLNQPERAAQSFILASRYCHPLAEMALAKVRQ